MVEGRRSWMMKTRWRKLDWRRTDWVSPVHKALGMLATTDQI